jgi:hypothetical protein
MYVYGFIVMCVHFYVLCICCVLLKICFFFFSIAEPTREECNWDRSEHLQSGCYISLFVNGEFLLIIRTIYLLSSLLSLIQNNVLLLARMFGESNTEPDGARKRVLFMVEFQYVSNNIVKFPTKNEIGRFVVVLLLLYTPIIIIYCYYYCCCCFFCCLFQWSIFFQL